VVPLLAHFMLLSQNQPFFQEALLLGGKKNLRTTVGVLAPANLTP
jgi:hypothetical protein